jgi:hypothetical protein
MNAGDCCRNCAFYEPPPKAKDPMDQSMEGKCRRHPPPQPITYEFYWCGEWKTHAGF